MISPTRLKIRAFDNHGSGYYGSNRGTRIHKGTDYICIHGQEIVSPINGKVIRRSRPYANGIYSGLLIRGEHIEIKMFYFKPDRGLIGKHVKAGQIIGVAQKISDKYPGMIDHIHLRIVSIDPEILMVMP